MPAMGVSFLRDPPKLRLSSWCPFNLSPQNRCPKNRRPCHSHPQKTFRLIRPPSCQVQIQLRQTIGTISPNATQAKPNHRIVDELGAAAFWTYPFCLASGKRGLPPILGPPPPIWWCGGLENLNLCLLNGRSFGVRNLNPSPWSLPSRRQPLISQPVQIATQHLGTCVWVPPGAQQTIAYLWSNVQFKFLSHVGWLWSGGYMVSSAWHWRLGAPSTEIYGKPGINCFGMWGSQDVFTSCSGWL